MLEEKQVEKSHYEFKRYMSKKRWNSFWHQIDEISRLDPENVLEIGPGPGIFKHTASLFGLGVETLDLDPELTPDHVGSATSLPFEARAYDVVCAFQMLEHLPCDAALKAFREMARVARKNIIISLPDAKTAWSYSFYVPTRGPFNFLMPIPKGARKHQFDGEHYWEVNKRNYPLAKIISDFGSVCKLQKTYRVFENPYHRFFVFKL